MQDLEPRHPNPHQQRSLMPPDPIPQQLAKNPAHWYPTSMQPRTWRDALTAAQDPTTPSTTLDDLEHIPALQPHLARNPNTRPQHLLTLAPHYREQARANPSLALAYLTHGAGRETELKNLLRKPTKTTNPHHPYTLDWPTEHPAYANPRLMRGALIDELIHRHRNNDRALEHLARNPNLQPQHFATLIRHPNPDTRYYATRNPALTTHTLLSEARDAHERGLPYQGALHAALAERHDPTAHTWLRATLPHDSSLRAFLTTPTPHTPSPRRHHNHHLRRLRDQLLTDPEPATQDLITLATDPTTHPTTRARAAISCHAALEATRHTDLLAHITPGPRARTLAQAQHDTLALTLIERALDARQHGEPDTVFIPF